MTDEFDALKTKLQDLQGNTVADDMLRRLELKLPKGAFGPLAPPVSDSVNNPFIIHDKIKKMEEETKKLKERFDELSSKTAATVTASGTQVGTRDTMKAACDTLEAAVDAFNASLDRWYEETGCVANFSWKYTPCKHLEIAGIDVIVYRKSAPSSLTIKEALESSPSEF